MKKFKKWQQTAQKIKFSIKHFCRFGFLRRQFPADMVTFTEKLENFIFCTVTGPGEDYTAGCLLDYDYIKNHYRFTAVDLSSQK